jgi:hypothetical protein
MPPEIDQDLAKLYAAMMAQQTPPTYDDGASLLQRNPALMDVGLFGKPKPKPVAPPVDIQRRKLFGLSETPTAPVPAPMPMQSPAMSPVYKALTTPMTRRDFLEHTARAAGNMALRGAAPELGALAETPAPLTEVAKSVGKTVADPHAAIWGTLREALQDRVADNAAEEVLGETYHRLRNELGDATLPKDILKKHDVTFDNLDKLEEYANFDDLDVSAAWADPDAETARYLAIHDDIADHLNDLVEHMPKGHVLTTMEEAGFEVDASAIAEMLHAHGYKPKQIHDFLDENHPGYDEDVINDVLQDLES